MSKVNLDWATLPFSYRATTYNIRYRFSNGKWDKGELSSDFNMSIPLAATALQYGQSIFEGLKAFEGPDGKVRLFRPDQNALRFKNSAEMLLMEPFPIDEFVKACHKVVQANLEYVPPHGSGASLYLRPFMIGTTPRIGVRPATEYEFFILVSPVGPYFPQGFKTSHLIVAEQFDRAAPRGLGQAKCAGNYAAGLRASKFAKDQGYTEVLYLDAVEKKYLEEAGPANFFAVNKQGQFVTPDSSSILRGITNLSLRELASQMGLEVQARPISVDELPTFKEAGLCGTAAVISPIGSVTYHGQRFAFHENGEKPGPICTQLYNTLTGIQRGEIADTKGWVQII